MLVTILVAADSPSLARGAFMSILALILTFNTRAMTQSDLGLESHHHSCSHFITIFFSLGKDKSVVFHF